MPENRPQWKNIRLKGCDYSTPDAYLVTVCTNEHKCIFGRIEKRQVVLNEIGNLVKECWQKIPEQFPNLQLNEFIVMPDHLHGIIIIRDKAREACLDPAREPAGSRKKTLGAVVGCFKSLVTRRVRRSGFFRGKAIWQRGYYEHVVTNKADLENIRDYIANNPARWSFEKKYISQ